MSVLWSLKNFPALKKSYVRGLVKAFWVAIQRNFT